MQCLVEIVRGSLGVKLRPEQVHDLLTVPSMVRRERQELNQAPHFAQAPFRVVDLPGPYGNLESTEQSNRQLLGVFAYFNFRPLIWPERAQFIARRAIRA
jgi:hypothetical protein